MKCTFKYKCRYCGKIFNGSSGGETSARFGLYHAVFGFDMPKRMIGTPPEMLDVHICENGSKGIGDLIGYSREKE